MFRCSAAVKEVIQEDDDDEEEREGGGQREREGKRRTKKVDKKGRPTHCTHTKSFCCCCCLLRHRRLNSKPNLRQSELRLQESFISEKNVGGIVVVVVIVDVAPQSSTSSKKREIPQSPSDFARHSFIPSQRRPNQQTCSVTGCSY